MEDLNILNNSKEYIIKLLEEIFKQKISDIEIYGIEQFKDITEYDFSLLKANVTYITRKKEKIYLKMIRGGKIKESIFCYWSVLYDEYLKSNQGSGESIFQKAIITQITSDESISSLLLTLNAKLNYCAEINLVELNNFAKRNKIYERWLDNLEIKKEDILFIGKKLY